LAKFALGRQKEMPRIEGPVESQASVEHLDSLSQLGRKSPRELVALLQNEDAQTIAFILSFFSKTLQSGFYEILSPGRKNEIKNIVIEKTPLSNVVFEKINEKLLEHVA
jgi:flagellar motor switch protein FliG